MFHNIAQKVARSKKAKIPTTNHVLKLQIKVKNIKNLLKQKAAQKIANILGYFILSKNHIELPKVAQLAKNCPIWSS